jgi:threonine dehydrogenase-like Zn-dependent dehydrogenase
LFPLPDALQAYGGQWQGFRAEYAPQEEDSARNGLPPDLAAAIKPYATFASVHRERVADGMNLNYTIGYYL